MTAPSPAGLAASSCAAVILCAGHSSRMGEPKPLLLLDGERVIERVVRLFRGIGIGEILAVLGHGADRLLPVAGRLGVVPVINDRYGEGMFSSVQAGVRRLGRDSRAFFLLPADIPFVRPDTLLALLSTFREGDTVLCRPCFGDRRGHPPLISAALIADILAFRGSGGLRALLALQGDRTADVPVADPGILVDLDTPADYRKALRDLAWPPGKSR